MFGQADARATELAPGEMRRACVGMRTVTLTGCIIPDVIGLAGWIVSTLAITINWIDYFGKCACENAGAKALAFICIQNSSISTCLSITFTAT